MKHNDYRSLLSFDKLKSDWKQFQESFFYFKKKLSALPILDIMQYHVDSQPTEPCTHNKKGAIKTAEEQNF